MYYNTQAKYKFEMENITLRLVILSSHRYLKICLTRLFNFQTKACKINGG